MNQIPEQILKKHTSAILNNVTEHLVIFNDLQPEVSYMFEFARTLLPENVSPTCLSQMLIGFMLAYFCIDEMLSANGVDELEKLFKLGQ